MTPLRIGLVGGGKHGSRYLHHLVTDLRDEARLVALCRRDPEAGARTAREHGCRFTPDVGELVEDPGVDAVAVAVPPTLHVDICRRAAAAGKAILLEKPMAPSVADAERIREALDAHPVPFMVAHTLRFNSVVRALGERIAAIAPVHAIHLSQRFEPSALPWLDSRAVSGGGIVIHTGVHSFDLLRVFSHAEARSVWCRTWQIHTTETEDNFVAFVTLGGGPDGHARIHATVEGSRSTGGRNGRIEIVGERGQLVGDHAHDVAYLIEGRRRTALPLAPPAATVLAALRAFVHAVRGGEPPPVGWEDGRAAVAIAEACYRSAAEAGTVGMR
jgi:predicted dehydrogenase